MLLTPIKFKRVEIHISVLALVFFALLFDFVKPLAFTYVMVFMHEMAHGIAALAFGVKLNKLEIMPFGICLKISGSYIKNPIHEVVIAAAGPACSGLLAYLCHRFSFGEYLVIANLAIAAINLVPALPLDGGRILKAYLTEQWGCVKAFNFTMFITRICAYILIVLGIALMFITGFNFSLILIAAFLIVNTIAEQRGSTHIMINEILRSREKLSGGAAERSGVIAISADEQARKVLKLLTYNRYYIIHVIDENMNILGTITETKLIEKLVEMGIRVKAGKIVDLKG